MLAVETERGVREGAYLGQFAFSPKKRTRHKILPFETYLSNCLLVWLDYPKAGALHAYIILRQEEAPWCACSVNRVK